MLSDNTKAAEFRFGAKETLDHQNDVLCPFNIRRFFKI